MGAYDQAMAVLDETDAQADAGYVTPLTAREHEVLALVRRGLISGEIAAELGITPSTVGVHVANIMRKMGVTKRALLGVDGVRAQGLPVRR